MNLSDARVMESRSLPTLGPALSPDEFSRVIGESVVELDIRYPDPAHFRGFVSGVSYGDTHLLNIASTGQAVSRTLGTIKRSPQEYFKFTLMERGAGVFVQDGREAVLNPGDMTIYSTDLPYTLHFDSEVRLSVLMFPKDMLRFPPQVVQSVTGTRISGASGIGAVVRSYISALAAHVHELDRPAERRLLQSAVGLVGELLEPLGDATVDRYGKLRRAATDYIEEHLGDPELGPAQVAQAHFVSLRQLYCAFEGTGTNVAGLIRSRRLERCFEELSDPRFVDLTAASIGLTHGFADAAHFSRAFKARYGVSPSSLRHR